MKRFKNIFASMAYMLVLLWAAATSSSAQSYEPKVGLQTWTLRNRNFDQLVEFCVKHKIKYVEVTDKHFSHLAAKEEIQRKKEILEKNGIQVYTFGVAKTSLNKEENRKLFEFAKFMGMKLIVVEPDDFKVFDNLEELVKEFDIKVAIHNHGLKSMYGNPLVVKNVLKHRDPRIGVCLDAGWITAATFDAAKVFREYEGRVYDIHLKDKRLEKTQGDDVSFDTHIGKGQANLKGLLAELKKSNWQGVIALETDSPEFANNPDEFVEGALKFVQENKP